MVITFITYVGPVNDELSISLIIYWAMICCQGKCSSSYQVYGIEGNLPDDNL